MDNEDVLRDNSPEIKEILTLADEISENMEQSIKINKPSLNGERYLNNKQVCDILHISPRSLQDYRDKGRIAFYKLEGKILFSESDVYKMLEDNYNKSWEQ
ncbi:helix-turn-helix protein [Dysgonomonas alginatilytica]|uniref:Helix-turn-helix protein n=1 Tax=Dysgonomonas alginatilytica TaxID=1605892 RepID=A0A2V3PH78_9BACT|nr:helix-turn-helix domain-containing protein [Dysgonomonas alginatilytica]PXV57159.1 helix-turn-helix protein [Dysgonomonas alginatilytica]